MASGKGTLAGKVAIVTGAGTGIGKGIALALAKEGASVVVAGRRVGPIEQTAKEVSAVGGKGLAIPTDVIDSQQVNRMVERTLAELGRIDILINCAGGMVRRAQDDPAALRAAAREEGRSGPKQIWEITDEEWHLGIDTNLTGAFYCSRAVAKHFVAQESGKIISIASGEGLRGYRGAYMYACAKAGIIQLTRVLAVTLVQNNIQVNCVSPGLVDTSAFQPEPRTGGGGGNPQFIPVGRLGQPADIGSICLFLASDASSYITGAFFSVDGGWEVSGYGPTGYAPVIPIKEA